MLKNFTLYTLFLLLNVGTALAQLHRIELSNRIIATEATQQHKAIQTLNLPFFDDFSTVTNGKPDSIWINGGTFVNNTLSKSPPSLGVVTFDGLKTSNRPYNFTNALAQGETDTLTSRPIDISGLSPKDSLYLTFFWQARGLGEKPDTEDSIRVQLLTNGNIWRTVWVQKGDSLSSKITDDNFMFAQIPIRANSYFHADFQFRFQSFGRQSGQYDVWNIDYVYLNKNRKNNDQYLRDIACRRPLSSLLKRYWAMPLNQYLVNPTKETVDSVATEIINLNNQPNLISYDFTIKDILGNTTLQRTTNNINSEIKSLAKQIKKIAVQKLPSNVTAKQMVLKYTFDIITTEHQNPSIPGIDLRRNDTISGYTTLSDYFAYDDGSAEYGAGINQKLSRTAVQYILNKPDILAGIRLNLLSLKKDQTGERFILQVYDNKNNKPNQLIYQQADSVKYPSTINGFVSYNFRNPVALRDTFYVGILQLTEEILPIGLDKNNPQFASQIFYNLSNEWIPNTANDVAGSLLLRPFFDNTLVITALEQPQPENSLIIYPNPSNGLLHWTDTRYKTLHLYNVQGQLVHTAEYTNAQANLEMLQNGIYYLSLSNGLEQKTVKIQLLK